MKKGLTELVMILDRSGSMSGLEKDTIGGFNSMIQRQKQEKISFLSGRERPLPLMGLMKKSHLSA